ncbi:nephrocan-like [Spea bombifrons]|uniref:nephrocan-like n=1 Tax=Spea bombifrons TaxID=233779 RepID=UPI00234AA164|nr:nephrocan-like [Spea bombifrons]
MYQICFLYIAAYLCSGTLASCPRRCTCDSPAVTECFRVSHLPRDIPATTRKLYIRHSKIRQLQISDFSRTLGLQEVSLFSSGTDTVENNTFKALSNLKVLEIWKNKLTNIPGLLPPNLEVLKLGDNSIGFIQRHDFEGLMKLKVLEMQNNILSMLSFNVFSALLHLQRLVLDNNGIQTISGQARLPYLRYLSMESNNLQYLPDNFFTHFTSLQYLGLSGNQLLKIPHHLPKALQRVQLKRNKIKYIKVKDVKHLENLSELNLSENHLSSVDGMQFLSNLSSVDLSRNQLVSLPSKLPTKLQRLDCSNNQISRVTTHDFKGLQNLKHLFLDNNVVSQFDDRALHWCVQLSSLAAEQNQLTSVPFGLPVSLTRLDLKGNTIEDISEVSFKNLKKLQVLNLRNNKITTLDHQVLECLTRLRHLYLDGNPWNCTCKLLTVKRILIDKGTDIKGGQCAEPSSIRGESWMSSDKTLRHCESMYSFDKGKESRKKLKADELSNVETQTEEDNDDDYDYDMEY